MKIAIIEDAIAEAYATLFLDSISESCEVACPSCGSQNTTCVPDAGARFCGACGHEWESE
jgi:hypothetical protein